MINTHVSDLFFNLDFDDCTTSHEDEGPAFDIDRVKQLAAWFVEALEGAGGPRVDADELVQDFFDRL